MGSGSNKHVEELRQCQLFKIGSKGSKSFSKSRKYSWHLIPCQSPSKLLGVAVEHSRARTGQSRTGYDWGRPEGRQQERRGEWDVELQGQSLLDSKAAAQDFSHAALLCS